MHDPECEVAYCPGIGCGVLIRKLRRHETDPTCRVCGVALKFVPDGNRWYWEVRELATAQR